MGLPRAEKVLEMEGTPAAKGDVEDGVAIEETETPLSHDDANDTLSSTAEPAAQNVSGKGTDEEKENDITDIDDENAHQKEHESATETEAEDTESKEEDTVKGNDTEIESSTEETLQNKTIVSSPEEAECRAFPPDQEVPGQEIDVDNEKEPDTLDEKMAAYFDQEENSEIDSSGDNKNDEHAVSTDEVVIENSSTLGVNATPPLPTNEIAPSTNTSDFTDDIDANKKAPPPEDEGPTIKRKSSNDAEDDDVSSKAAIALAAVAAAATANHKSPAEAAAQARMVAQTLLSTNESNTIPECGVENPRKFQSIRLTLVKTHLRQRALEAGSQLMDKLAMGQNDAFLQHLLLLEYLRAVGDDETSPNDEAVDDPAVANLACDRVWSLLKKIEGAYESLLQLLPDAAISTN